MALNGVTSTSTPTQTTDATFRAWGSHFSAQILAAGFVKAPDTGQIDWTTVTTPAGANASQGYEIWRFDDPLQATAPIYFKVEYGSAAAATTPATYWTFGTGSNGSGTLTGPVSVRQQITSTAYATNPLTNYWSADGTQGRFSVAMWASGTGVTTSNCCYIAFERTKDSNGDDTNQGLLIVWKPIAGNGSTAFQSLFWDRVIGTVYNPTRLLTLMPTGTTMKNGTQIGVSPVFLFNGPALNPGLNCLAYMNADIVALGAVTFQMYGQSRVYMPIGSTAYSSTSINSEATTPSLMVRYD